MQLRASSQTLPPLFCIPMAVKDNIDVVGTATTAGAVALLDNIPTTDAPVVRAVYLLCIPNWDLATVPNLLKRFMLCCRSLPSKRQALWSLAR